MNGRTLLDGEKYRFNTEAAANDAIAKLCGDKVEPGKSGYRIVNLSA